MDKQVSNNGLIEIPSNLIETEVVDFNIDEMESGKFEIANEICSALNSILMLARKS